MDERLAILGGTFDPIHFGHLALGAEICWQLDVARVFFVPAAQQPFKANLEVTAAHHRLAMVRIATAGNSAFDVCDLEIVRGGRSYSFDTVTTLQEDNPQAELIFVVGADVLRDLHRWYRIEQLLALCRFVVVNRPGYQLDLDPVFAVLPAARDRIMPIVGPALDISSTDLRARLARGAPVRYQVPDTVLQYVQEHGLYRPRA